MNQNISNCNSDLKGYFKIAVYTFGRAIYLQQAWCIEIQSLNNKRLYLYCYVTKPGHIMLMARFLYFDIEEVDTDSMFKLVSLFHSYRVQNYILHCFQKKKESHKHIKICCILLINWHLTNTTLIYCTWLLLKDHTTFSFSCVFLCIFYRLCRKFSANLTCKWSPFTVKLIQIR